MAAEKRQDGASNVALNGIRVMDQRLADKLRVPVGETVAWSKAFPRPEHEQQVERRAA